MRAIHLLTILSCVYSVGCASTPSAKKPEPQTSAATKPLDPGTAEFWDSAYSGDSFLYGEKPNTFFANFIDGQEPGNVLLPGEGEGRNAVYAAQKGWRVTAFDLSETAKKKADEFAAEKEVSIQYTVDDFSTVDYDRESFDAIAIVFLHVPTDVFNVGMPRLLKALKPGGELLIQVFSENHANSASKFGPKSPDVLLTLDEITFVLGEDWTISVANEVDIILDEGRHQGPGSVIEFRATKPGPDVGPLQ